MDTTRKITARLYERGIDSKIILDAIKMPVQPLKIYHSKDNVLFTVVEPIFRQQWMESSYTKGLMYKTPYCKLPLVIRFKTFLDKAIYIFFLNNIGKKYCQSDFGNHNVENANAKSNFEALKNLTYTLKGTDATEELSKWTKSKDNYMTSFSRIKNALSDVFGKFNYTHFFINSYTENNIGLNQMQKNMVYRSLDMDIDLYEKIDCDYTEYRDEILSYESPLYI